ncbi:MAG: hypothetical protein R3E89_02625 [Thiolinea sp.]
MSTSGLGTSMASTTCRASHQSLPLASAFSFDANGRMITSLDAVELRDDVDDDTPGVTLVSYGSSADWGPNPVVMSRSFATEVGARPTACISRPCRKIRVAVMCPGHVWIAGGSFPPFQNPR